MDIKSGYSVFAGDPQQQLAEQVEKELSRAFNGRMVMKSMNLQVLGFLVKNGRQHKSIVKGQSEQSQPSSLRRWVCSLYESVLYCGERREDRLIRQHIRPYIQQQNEGSVEDEYLIFINLALRMTHDYSSFRAIGHLKKNINSLASALDLISTERPETQNFFYCEGTCFGLTASYLHAAILGLEALKTFTERLQLLSRPYTSIWFFFGRPFDNLGLGNLRISP